MNLMYCQCASVCSLRFMSIALFYVFFLLINIYIIIINKTEFITVCCACISSKILSLV